MLYFFLDAAFPFRRVPGPLRLGRRLGGHALRHGRPGFGRFALGMQLPAMAATLKLSYSQMGFIGTANFLGYLVSALLSARASGRIGRESSSFSPAVGGVLAGRHERRGRVPDGPPLYMAAGIGSAGANIPIMGLVSAWFGSRLRGRAAGFIVIGSGLAIMITGS
jgi:MFS family permease